MKLVWAAIDPQQAAAEPKDRICGWSRALPGGFGRKKAFEFPILPARAWSLADRCAPAAKIAAAKDGPSDQSRFGALSHGPSDEPLVVGAGGQAQVREERRIGHPDLCIRRRQPGLGRGDLGPALKQGARQQFGDVRNAGKVALRAWVRADGGRPCSTAMACSNWAR